MGRVFFALTVSVALACGDAEPVNEPESPIVSKDCQRDADCDAYGAALDAPVECGPRDVCVDVPVECETVEDCAPWTYFELCEGGVCIPDFRDDPK